MRSNNLFRLCMLSRLSSSQAHSLRERPNRPGLDTICTVELAELEMHPALNEWLATCHLKIGT